MGHLSFGCECIQWRIALWLRCRANWLVCEFQFARTPQRIIKVTGQGSVGRFKSGWHRFCCQRNVHGFSLTYCSRAFSRSLSLSFSIFSLSLSFTSARQKTRHFRDRTFIALLPCHASFLPPIKFHSTVYVKLTLSFNVGFWGFPMRSLHTFYCIYVCVYDNGTQSRAQQIHMANTI